MPTDPAALTLALVALFIGSGGIGALIHAVLTNRRETKDDEATDNRETSATLISALSARIAEVEAQLVEQSTWRRTQEAKYSALWAYCRELVDYAYRHRRADSPPLPDMPASLI